MMPIKEILVIAGGSITLGIAIFHLLLSRILNWNTSLQSLDATNRGFIQIMNLGLSFLFVGFFYLSAVYTHELVASSFGNALLGVMTIFWSILTYCQWHFFKLKSKLSLLVFFLGLILSINYLYILFL